MNELVGLWRKLLSIASFPVAGPEITVGLRLLGGIQPGSIRMVIRLLVSLAAIFSSCRPGSGTTQVSTLGRGHIFSPLMGRW